MENEKTEGAQSSRELANRDVSLVDGGIKILARQKPVTSSFGYKEGQVFVVLDCSGSMKGNKLEQAKQGTIDFMRDAVKKEYRVGLINFSTHAEERCEPTFDTDLLQNRMANLKAGGSTNMTEAIQIAHTRLKDFKGFKVMVIATDGMPDNVESALDAAFKAKADGIDIITIGTDDADTEFLQHLASRIDLSSKVSNQLLAQAISSASLLLESPKTIKPV